MMKARRNPKPHDRDATAQSKPATLERRRDIATETLVWQGITVDVSYEADWLGSGGRNTACAMSHLEVQAVEPERAPLPITETGYRSHFLSPGAVEEMGGPAAYVAAWLDEAAKSKEWRRHIETSRQLLLF